MIIYTINQDKSLSFYFKDDSYELQDNEHIISDEEYYKLYEKGGGDIRINPLTNKIDIVPIEIPENIIEGKFNYEKWQWEEKLSLEEQLEYYKNLIIQKTKELANYEMAGFSNATLSKELEELKKKHMEISHELANQINLTY